MRILLTGSRTWTKRGPIEALMLGLKAQYPDAHFILGDNPSGLDGIALGVANTHDLSVEVHVAEWDKHGRGAGPRRNGEMVRARPDVAFAFRDEGRSPGTDDCVEQARMAGVPTYVTRTMPSP